MKNKKTFFIMLLLWIMPVYFFQVISSFSNQPAVLSAGESRGIVRIIIQKAECIQETICKYLPESQSKKVEKFFDEKAEDILHFIIRKGAHFLNFFILGFLYTMLALWILNHLFTVRSIFNAVAAALICGLLAAIVDELHQWFIPGRSAEIRDVVIDFSGVFLGCIVVKFGLLRRKK
jgi:VanZ family protein